MWRFKHSIISHHLAPQAIWEVWSNVAHWPDWDRGISWSRCDEFKQGGTITLKPHKGPLTVCVINALESQQKFTTLTALPLKTELRFEHDIKKTANGIKITHQVTIKGPLTFLFKLVIGKKLVKDLPLAMENLLALAHKVA